MTNKTGGDKFQLSNDLNDFCFELELNKEADCKVIKGTDRMARLQNIKIFLLSFVENNDIQTKLFMKDIAPSQVNEFFFKGHYCKDDDKTCVDTEFYFDTIIQVCQKTTQQVRFFNCSFSDVFLSDLMKSCNLVPCLVFHSCKFVFSSSLSFCDPEYKTSTISFQGSGCTHGQDWSSYAQLSNLISAMGQSSLKNSLTKLYFIYCGVDQIQIKQLLTENQIEADVELENWI